MYNANFPQLNVESNAATLDALHGYARVLGDVIKACRPRRKHWWHASLRPSLQGLSTGVVRSADDFELVLDFHAGQCRARSSSGKTLDVELRGQSASAFAESLTDFLQACGVDADRIEAIAGAERGEENGNGFSAAESGVFGQVLAEVAAAFEQFRAGIPEETSPIQLWPHHFDLSMIWLPGEKIPGQDPGNEEYSDKQMNFGFAFGDAGIPEPYFYVTAYPTPDGMSDLDLPDGAEWKTDGFSGAVVLYKHVAASANPNTYLQDFWTLLLKAGRAGMLDNKD